MSQVNLIVNAINSLGGLGTLNDIYKAVNDIAETPEPSIRRTIYQHSSECDIYEPSREDIFYAPHGKGEGVWAIRDKTFSIFPVTTGTKILRKDLHEQVGGSVQGGICPTSSGHILLFSDPEHGEEFGYFDGWQGETYLYYGQGQDGDMEFTRNNKSLLNHKADGKRVQLFKGAKGEVVYEGQFELDELRPYDLVEDKDMHDEERVAIVFRLVPIKEHKTTLPETNIKLISQNKIEVADIERHITESTDVTYTADIQVERKESKLVTEYQDFLGKNNLPKLSRLIINIEGEASSLKTDGWIEENNTLLEAKSSASRNSIRAAIGQLLDYKFQIENQGIEVRGLAILLPQKPRESLLNLLTSLKINLIYKDGNKFITTS